MPSLKFANVDLCFDLNHQAESFLSRFQCIEDLVLWPNDPVSHGSWQTNPAGEGQRIGTPRINWPEPPPLRLNQVYWPTGATRFAYGLFLCTTEAKTAIEALDCTVPQDFVSKTSTDPPIPGTDGTDDPLCNFTAKMFALSFHRFAGVKGEACEKTDDVVTGNDLFILVLVDRRYWWRLSGAANFSALLESTDSNCVSSCTATWDDLFQDLGEVLGITFQHYTQALAYEYFGPDCRELQRPYDNAALILDALAASVGGRVVVNYDGTGSIQHPAEALVALNQNLANMKQQLAGYDCEDLRPRTRPALAQVVFPKIRNHHLPCKPEYYAVPVSNADSGCGFGYTKTIHSTSFADMGNDCGVGTVPVNYSDLNALAAQIAADWFSWCEREYDFTWSSPRPWTPCGFDDHILIKFGQEHEDHLDAATHVEEAAGGLTAETAMIQVFRRDHQTRVQSWPQDVGTDSQWHGTDAELLPDQILVELSDCWGIDDRCCNYECQEAPAWPTNTAHVMKWCDCDWVDSGTDVTVSLSTGFICNSSMRDQLQHLLAYCGLSNSNTNGWGCFPVKAGCGELKWANWNCDSERYELIAEYDDIWKFQLNEELCSGDSAEAQLILHDCCNADEDIPDTWIYTNVTFTLNDKLELICPDKTYGTKTSSSSGDCVCQCTTGCLPVGTQGWAKYSPNRCYPNECNFDLLSFQSCEPPQFAYVELQENLCGDINSDVEVDEESAEFVNASGWTEKLCKVHAKIPLYACEGDKVLLMRDCEDDGSRCWTIIQVPDHVIPYVKSVDYSDNCEDEDSATKACQLNKTTSTAAVHLCCEEIDDSDPLITFETLDVVIGAGMESSCCETSGAPFIAYQFRTRKICAIACGDEEGTVEAASLEPITVVSYIYDDGTCVYYDYATAYVFCVCDENYANELFCTEPCTASSS